MLTVWVISGIDFKARTVQKELQNSSLHRGDRKKMTFFTESGWVGAMKRVMIPFQEIYMK